MQSLGNNSHDESCDFNVSIPSFVMDLHHKFLPYKVFHEFHIDWIKQLIVQKVNQTQHRLVISYDKVNRGDETAAKDTYALPWVVILAL